MELLQSWDKKLLKQWLDFPIEKRIETMDRLALIQGMKTVKSMVRFSNWKKITTMDRFTKIQG